MKPEKRAAARPRDRSRKDVWRLRLYVADGSPKSRTALSNLRRICAEHLEGRYQIEVVDLRQNPRLARGDQIVAVPTLVRRLPEPIKSPHLWKGRIPASVPAGDHVLSVRGTDVHGRWHTARRAIRVQ